MKRIQRRAPGVSLCDVRKDTSPIIKGYTSFHPDTGLWFRGEWGQSCCLWTTCNFVFLEAFTSRAPQISETFIHPVILLKEQLCVVWIATIKLPRRAEKMSRGRGVAWDGLASCLGGCTKGPRCFMCKLTYQITSLQSIQKSLLYKVEWVEVQMYSYGMGKR